MPSRSEHLAKAESNQRLAIAFQAQHLYATRYEPIKRHLQPVLGFMF